MKTEYKCPKCGAFATERKSRSKGAKDRFRCYGKPWKRKDYVEGKHVSTTYGFTPSCGLFGLKDLKKENKDEEI